MRQPTYEIIDQWTPIEGFPGYSVSPSGHVRNDSRGLVLHIRVNQYGVPYVGLMRAGRRHQCVRSLPRLVAETFVPQPNDVFDTPINLNGNRIDCRVENLAWRPRWYASYYFNQFRERYGNAINVSIRDVDTGEEYPNSLAVACANGLLERDVVLSIHNNTLTWPTYQQFTVAD